MRSQRWIQSAGCAGSRRRPPRASVHSGEGTQKAATHPAVSTRERRTLPAAIDSGHFRATFTISVRGKGPACCSPNVYRPCLQPLTLHPTATQRRVCRRSDQPVSPTMPHPAKTHLNVWWLFRFPVAAPPGASAAPDTSSVSKITQARPTATQHVARCRHIT